MTQLYKKHLLTFRGFQNINANRSKVWMRGRNWSFDDWFTALAGEVGELCNVVKKLNRYREDMIQVGTGSIDELHQNVKDETSDIITYAFLIAENLGVSIESSFQKIKFNDLQMALGYFQNELPASSHCKNMCIALGIMGQQLRHDPPSSNLIDLIEHCFIFAQAMKFNLAEAVIEKFNVVSEKQFPDHPKFHITDEWLEYWNNQVTNKDYVIERKLV